MKKQKTKEITIIEEKEVKNIDLDNVFSQFGLLSFIILFSATLITILNGMDFEQFFYCVVITELLTFLISFVTAERITTIKQTEKKVRVKGL